MATRELDESDLELFKTLRLQALATDPEAFGSNLQREQAFDDNTWRTRLLSVAGRPGVIVADEINGQPAGLVGMGETDTPGVGVIWTMWVAPHHRRQGAGRRLIEAAIDHARQRNLHQLELTVHADNDMAYNLYLSVGFVDTGIGDRPRDREMTLTLKNQV